MVWPAVERILGPHIDFISSGRYALSDIREEVERCEQALWLVMVPEIIAVATTRVIDYPRKRMLSCQFCAGEKVELWLKPLHEKLEAFRKDCGCVGQEMTGRHGWRPFLKKLNWKKGDWSMYET